MEKRHENWDVQRMEWKAALEAQALEALGSGFFLSQSQFLLENGKLSVNEAQFLIYMWSTTNCRRYTASQVNGKVSSYLLFFGGLKLTSH